MKLKKKKKEGAFLWAMIALMAASLIVPMASSLIQPVASSLINTITRKGVGRAGKGQESRFLSLLSLPLMMKAMLGRGSDKMNHTYENF